jgi:hypothetical protein
MLSRRVSPLDKKTDKLQARALLTKVSEESQLSAIRYDLTHSSSFRVGILSLVDRRKPTLAAASASWALRTVASSRCTLVQAFFGRRGLVAGLGRLRIGDAGLLFAFFRDDVDDDGEARLRGDALSCLFGLGFLCAGYSRARFLPCQILTSVKSCTNFLTAYDFRPMVISCSRTFSASNCDQWCKLSKLVSLPSTMPDVRGAIGGVQGNLRGHGGGKVGSGLSRHGCGW